ncbi:hypothetical protein ACFLQV_01220 [Calditrichota bacterium]
MTTQPMELNMWNQTSILRLLVVLMITVSFLGTSLIAAEPQAVSGNWQGTVLFSESSQPLINLSFRTDDNGDLKGEMILPMQDSKKIELTNLSMHGDSVIFEIANERSEAQFMGTYSQVDSQITGNFIQAGYTYPFSLNKLNTEITSKK